MRCLTRCARSVKTRRRTLLGCGQIFRGMERERDFLLPWSWLCEMGLGARAMDVSGSMVLVHLTSHSSLSVRLCCTSIRSPLILPSLVKLCEAESHGRNAEMFFHGRSREHED